MPAPPTLPNTAAATLIVGRGGDALRPLFQGTVRCQEAAGEASDALDGVTHLVLADPAISRHAAMNWLAHADRFGIQVWMHAPLLPILKTAGLPPRQIGTTAFHCFAGLRDRPCPGLGGVAVPLLALVILPCVLPLLALLALRVWLTDGRPVVFAQKRIGYRGVPFTIYKFRTMHPTQQAKSITEAGERLRRHGLDELPQIFNLLRGNMSLIGPRPLPVDEHPQDGGIGAWMSTREQVMPGLTGLYQICPHRRTLGLAEMCVLDAYWIHNRTLRLNAWILLRTAVAMFQGWGRPKGAGHFPDTRRASR
jgi:lipopolysaccharide/colanic/teichoic acid biosynthesis glycosyltransferase